MKKKKHNEGVLTHEHFEVNQRAYSDLTPGIYTNKNSERNISFGQQQAYFFFVVSFVVQFAPISDIISTTEIKGEMREKYAFFTWEFPKPLIMSHINNK